MINHKIWLTLLLCLLLCACLLPAAYADGLNDLQEAIGSYNQTGNPNSFTLNEAINAQGTAITIPSGFTLTLNKNLVCGDLAIEQGGAVVVNYCALNTWTGTLTLDGTLTLNGGRYAGNATNFPVLKAAYEAQPQRLYCEDNWSYNAFEAVYDSGSVSAAINRANEIEEYFGDEHTAEQIQIYFDWTIPQGTFIDADKAGIELDRTLTVLGGLKCRQYSMHPGASLLVDGGTMIVPGDDMPTAFLSNPIPANPQTGGITLRNAWVETRWDSWEKVRNSANISYEGDAGFIFKTAVNNDDAALTKFGEANQIIAALGSDHAKPTVVLNFNCTLNEAINAQDTAITIPSGFTLTLNKNLVCGDLAIEQGGSALVDGGRLTVMGYLTVDGALTLDGVWADVGAISLNNIAAALEAEPARISFVGDAGFILKRNCGNEDNAIHPDFGAITGTKRILDRLGTEHTRAVALIDCDVTIPESSFLNAGQGEIVIQRGKTLTVEGGLFGKILEIEPDGSLAANGLISVDEFCDNGAVSVGESGFIQVKRSFSIGQDVTAFVLNGTLSIKNTALSDPTQLEVVANNGMLDIYFELFDEDALLAELNAPTGNFGDHFRRSLWVLFPWEMSDDLTLPGHVHLCVSSQGSDQGCLTIPEGVLLTIPETGQLFTAGDAEETVVQLNGGLVNNGEIALGDEMGYDPGEIAFGSKGFYAGFGTVTRLGRSDQILNDRTHADLLLPADLTKIESEALAGGVFGSVFIPDGTMSIADDAFGNREIVIFGELGSFAETYARDNGYCFAPVA